MGEEIAQTGYDAELTREFLARCEGLTVEFVNPQPASLEALAIECRPSMKVISQLHSSSKSLPQSRFTICFADLI